MKLFILLAIIGSALAIPDARGIKQEIFNRFVNQLGANHGLNLGLNVQSHARFPVLPPLPLPDPLPIPDISFELPEDFGMTLAASLSNGAVEGLSTWKDDLALNILTQRVTYKADIKSVKLSGTHTFFSEFIFVVPLISSANGALLATVDGSHFDVGFTLAVNFTTTRVYVKNVAINLGFDQASYFAENAKFIEIDVNWDVVNGQIKPVFEQTWNMYKPGMEGLLTDVLNEVVGRYTLAEIIQFIINIGKPKTTTAAPIGF